MSFVAAVLTAQYSPRPGDALFMTLWLSFWSVGVVWLVTSTSTAWRLVRAGVGGSALGRAVRLTLFTLPFLAAELGGLALLAGLEGVAGVLVVGGGLCLNAVFLNVLKTPTVAGQKLMDRIAGFRVYLAASREGRGRESEGPALTREVFDRYLPYAMALDLDGVWAGRFEAALAAAGDALAACYAPSWYSGTALATTAHADFGAALGESLSFTIRASVAASGPSSGGGDGGSSGGGDGGGGGGGW